MLEDHSEKGSMHCVIKYIVRGNQARVKNADLRHPSCTVVMYRSKSASPVHNVLKYTSGWIFFICSQISVLSASSLETIKKSVADE